jgi:hypothetical protein
MLENYIDYYYLGYIATQRKEERKKKTRQWQPQDLSTTKVSKNR